MKFSDNIINKILEYILYTLILVIVYRAAYDRGWKKGSSDTLNKVIEIINYKSTTVDPISINTVTYNQSSFKIFKQ